MFSEASRTLSREFYFDDPRLHMTALGRFVVRVVSYASYFLLAATVFVALFSDIEWLFFLGVLLGFFLIDRFLHWRDADWEIIELSSEGRVNLASVVSPAAFLTVERAYDRSFFTRTDFFLQVARYVLNARVVRDGLKRMDVAFDEFRAKTEEFIAESVSENSKRNAAERRGEAETMVKLAFQRALINKNRFIEIGDLFGALPLTRDNFLTRLFAIFGIEPDDLDYALIFSGARDEFRRLRRMPRALGGVVLGAERRMRHRVMNRAWTSRPTPTLDRHGTDLTELARHEEVGFLVGHEEEYRRLVDTLSRPVNPNALLVGEVGIGKETLVAHLAFNLVKDRVPPPLFDKRLVALDLSRLVAGASEEEVQKRIQIIVEEITMAGNVVLYVPDVHNLVKTSGTAYLSAADALVPVIMNDAFPIVGATYPREFKEFIEPRSDFAHAFEVIRVDEVSEAEAQKILVYESIILESQMGIVIGFGAVKAAVKLAKKYLRNRFLPSSAEALLKDAAVEVKRRGEKFVGADAVIREAEEKTNVPIREATATEASKLLRLEEIIHERLVDQDEAVKAVADALRAYRSGLTRPGGPIANFLFVGPTGVGKTELSKILTRIQFGEERAMIRFDMTEYQDKMSFYRFIGSPDGKISGVLTDAVLERPYSLILLDEFEKAYPDILGLFLQVFDDGRLTDNLGRTVDFSNTIIIATSNAHSDLIHQALSQGETVPQIAEYLKKRLVDVFRPELLNRFSRIVVFRDLGPREVEKIAAIQVGDVVSMLREKGIELVFAPEAVQRLAKWGYDPAFGARPLRRVIEEKVRAPLSEKLLSKEMVRGGSVRITLQGDELAFETGEARR